MCPHHQSLEKVHRFAKLLVPKHRNRVYLCPVSVDSQSPVFVFQSLMVSSLLPLANIVPSGLKVTDLTLRFDEMSQHTKQLDKRRKLDKIEKKNLTNLSARSPDTWDWPFPKDPNP
jgi:hypothetical protein